MKNLKTKNILLISLSFITIIGFTIYKLLFDMKYLNAKTYQYDLTHSKDLVYSLLILGIICIAIFVIAYLFNKDNKTVINTNNYIEKTSGLLIIILNIVTILSVLISKSIKSSFTSDIMVSKIFLIAFFVSSLFAGISLFKGINKSKTYFLYYLVVLSPLFYFISSYFSRTYTINNTDRILCGFVMLLFSLFMFLIGNEFIFNKQSKFSLPLSYVINIIGTIYVLIEIYKIVVIGVSLTSLNLSQFVIIGYLVYSYYYMIKKIIGQN